MPNKVNFNIQNVHYAVIKDDGTYDTVKHIPGAVTLTTDATGDDSTFWADGIAYWKTFNNTGYEGTLTLALLPDEFREDVLGEIRDTKNVLLEDARAKTVNFALGFQTDGDQESTYFWFFKCTASRPSTEANTTTESKDPDTQELSWSCAPNPDGYVRAKTTPTTAQADLSTWFDAVYEPVVSNG